MAIAVFAGPRQRLDGDLVVNSVDRSGPTDRRDQILELQRGERTLLVVRINGAADVSDEDACRAAAGGHVDAFASVYDRHVDAVYAVCRRWSVDRADAEDMTSLVFLEAIRRIDRVRCVDGSARPWLLRVATNVARNQSRSRRRYEHLVARLPYSDPAADVADEVVSTALTIERVQQVQAAISRLRAGEQDVIRLCDLADLAYEDASRVLAIPVGTVRSRLSRGRARLKAMLGDLEPDVHPSVLARDRGNR